MDEEFDNPLDDELLKELGLEPKAKPAVKPKPAKSFETKAPPPPPPAVPKPSIPPVSPKTAAVPSRTEEPFEKNLKNLAADMPVQVVAVLGKKTMTLKEVVALKQGEVLELKKLPQESIDLVANGKLVARGDLVLIDGRLGIQIKQLVG